MTAVPLLREHLHKTGIPPPPSLGPCKKNRTDRSSIQIKYTHPSLLWRSMHGEDNVIGFLGFGVGNVVRVVLDPGVHDQPNQRSYG